MIVVCGTESRPVHVSSNRRYRLSRSQSLNATVANLVLTQAASALKPLVLQQAPATSHLLAQSALPTIPAPSVPSNQAFALQLKQTYDQHLRANNLEPKASVKPPAEGAGANGALSGGPQPVQSNGTVRSSPSPTPEARRNDGPPRSSSQSSPKKGASKPRTAEDKAAGTILIGFLSSLRDSYEEALREKKGFAAVSNDGGSSDGDGDRRTPGVVRKAPPSVTDVSSQQAESSVEDSDWNSDKKTDPSSSEDSDKEEKDVAKVSKGPPRKRLKKSLVDAQAQE